MIQVASTHFSGGLAPLVDTQISPWINVGRGFVHDDDLVLPEHGAGQADQLALAGREVRPGIGQKSLQSVLKRI